MSMDLSATVCALATPPGVGGIAVVRISGPRAYPIAETVFRPANPDLRPERLWSYELSFAQRRDGGRLSYGANLFYINGDNLIMRVPVDGRQQNVNAGRIENWGAEASVTWRWSAAWSVMSNYSWLHMEQPVLASPEHKLFAGLGYHRKRWRASTGVQYVKGSLLLYCSIFLLRFP